MVILYLGYYLNQVAGHNSPHIPTEVTWEEFPINLNSQIYEIDTSHRLNTSRCTCL